MHEMRPSAAQDMHAQALMPGTPSASAPCFLLLHAPVRKVSQHLSGTCLAVSAALKYGLSVALSYLVDWVVKHERTERVYAQRNPWLRPCSAVWATLPRRSPIIACSPSNRD